MKTLVSNNGNIPYVLKKIIEEGKRIYRPKSCVTNNKDKDISSENFSNNAFLSYIMSFSVLFSSLSSSPRVRYSEENPDNQLANKVLHYLQDIRNADGFQNRNLELMHSFRSFIFLNPSTPSHNTSEERKKEKKRY